MPTLLILVGLLLLVDGPPASKPPSITPEERKTFEAERASAGTDPSKLIKLALWAESKGLNAERTALLKDAAAADPKDRSALGLLGLMTLDGQVKSPEEAARDILSDQVRARHRAEYVNQRDKLSQAEEAERNLVARLENSGEVVEAREVQSRINHRLAPAHLKLGNWCDAHGLKPEAAAHYTSAVVLDPHSDQAWKHLGYARHNGRWLSHDQIVAEQKQVVLQHEADRHWGPLLTRWKLELSEDSKRAKAQEELARINDPLALPSILKTFLTSNPKPLEENHQNEAVTLMGQIETSASTKELATLAIKTRFASVRNSAARILKERDPRDYAEMLVKSIHSTWTYQVTPMQGPGTQGQLVIDSPRFSLIRQYDSPLPFKLNSSFHGYVGIDPNGLPVVISGSELSHLEHDLQIPRRQEQAEQELEAAEEKTAELLSLARFESAAARKQMNADLREIRANNARAVELNSRIKPILELAMDAPQSLGDNEDAWNSWYYEKIGYNYTPTPKHTYRQSYPHLPVPRISSCFAAGTPVRTLDGLQKIETLKVGDQVLSQDVQTGALSYQPILVIHHNPPDKTVAISTDNGDRIIASRFHRFWRAGRGWVMARDLQVGDELRTLGGLCRVRSLGSGPVVPVFNLDVADARTYFVGNHDALVHDNTLPARVEAPFDTRAEINLGR
jgi:tetratricopeptide (TPR) repeat protein